MLPAIFCFYIELSFIIYLDHEKYCTFDGRFITSYLHIVNSVEVYRNFMFVIIRYLAIDKSGQSPYTTSTENGW